MGSRPLIERIGSGTIKTVAIDTPEPSPFSHEILNANPYAYLDDAPLEERRARAVQMRRTLGSGCRRRRLRSIRLRSRKWPPSRGPSVRDSEELHDALLTLIVVPPAASWEPFFATLRDAGRSTVLTAGGANFWVAAERLKSARLLYPDAVATPEIQDFDRTTASDQSEAAAELLRGWLESTGPQTQSGLAMRLCAPTRRDGSGIAPARS